jgi:transcription elongation factor GreA
METQEFLTVEKKKQLEQELEHLKTDVRNEILERLAFAKSLGDLSENAEYHSSKEAQGKNEARISQIEAILKTAVIVEANTDGTVGLGSRVVLQKEGADETVEYQIVGNEEADLTQGKMSFTSPIGSAVMNKQEGDVVAITTPRGETRYTILKVT